MAAERKPKTPLHLRLTCEDWVETFKELNRAELGVLYYIRCLDPYGDRELEVDSTEVSEKLGIHRTSVSRALKALNDKQLISLEITKAKVSSKAKNRKATLLCMDAHQVHGRTSNCTNAQQTSMDAQDESVGAQQECMDAQQSYIRNVRAENTISDLDQTNSNCDQTIPPNPPEGESIEALTVAEIVEEEVNVPPSQENISNLRLPNPQSNSVLDKSSERRVATNAKRTKLAEKELQYFFRVYQSEKPGNFINHKQLSPQHAKAIKKLVDEYSDRSLEIFAAALIWVREQDNDWWRVQSRSLGLDELISNGKLFRFADKHFDALESDKNYRDRVEGRAMSKDKARNNGFLIINENGERVTGVSAECAEAVANDPMLQFFLEAKL